MFPAETQLVKEGSTLIEMRVKYLIFLIKYLLTWWNF